MKKGEFTVRFLLDQAAFTITTPHDRNTQTKITFELLAEMMPKSGLYHINISTISLLYPF